MPLVHERGAVVLPRDERVDERVERPLHRLDGEGEEEGAKDVGSHLIVQPQQQDRAQQQEGELHDDADGGGGDEDGPGDAEAQPALRPREARHELRRRARGDALGIEGNKVVGGEVEPLVQRREEAEALAARAAVLACHLLGGGGGPLMEEPALRAPPVLQEGRGPNDEQQAEEGLPSRGSHPRSHSVKRGVARRGGLLGGSGGAAPSGRLDWG